jgi:hypothetical protein
VPAPGPARPTRPHPLLVALLAVLLLAVALPWLALRRQDPEEVVGELLDALVAGDVEQVRAHLAPAPGSLDGALTAALHAVTADGVTGYTIEQVEVRGTSATVTAILHSPLEQQRTVLALTARTSGPFTPVTWQLVPFDLPLLTLGPLTGADAVLLNGQRLEIPEVRWNERGVNLAQVGVRVLPGRYEIALPPAPGPLLPRVREVYVPPVLGRWQTGLMTVDYSLAPQAELEARAEIRGALADCLASRTARPVGCPFGADLPEGTVGTWTLLRGPSIAYAQMTGDTFEFHGEGMLADFTVAQGEGPAAGTVHRVRAVFGATVVRGVDGCELVAWSFTSLRPLR